MHEFEIECGKAVNNNDGKLSRELILDIEEKILKVTVLLRIYNGTFALPHTQC